MGQATYRDPEVVVEEVLLDSQIVRTTVVVNHSLKRVLEKSYVLHKLRNREVFVAAVLVVAVGKSTMQVEEAVSAARVHTGTIIMLMVTFVADIRIVPTIMVQEKVLANSGYVRVVQGMQVVPTH